MFFSLLLSCSLSIIESRPVAAARSTRVMRTVVVVDGKSLQSHLQQPQSVWQHILLQMCARLFWTVIRVYKTGVLVQVAVQERKVAEKK